MCQLNKYRVKNEKTIESLNKFIIISKLNFNYLCPARSLHSSSGQNINCSAKNVINKKLVCFSLK